MEPTAETPPRRLALHACCGPCLLEPYDALAEEAESTVVVFANSNIAPAEEYALRRDTLRAYAAGRGIDVVELPYEPDSWNAAVAGCADREARCRACFQLRLGQVARWAAENGCDAITTTLTVSPYQDPEAIRAAGAAAAQDAGVRWVDRDFRERYGEATRRSRELEMYRQNYCGCLSSRAVAEAERSARRAARAARRADER